MPDISSLEMVAGFCLTFCYAFVILPDNLAILDVFPDKTGAHQELNWELGFQW